MGTLSELPSSTHPLICTAPLTLLPLEHEHTPHFDDEDDNNNNDSVIYYTELITQFSIILLCACKNIYFPNSASRYSWVGVPLQTRTTGRDDDEDDNKCIMSGWVQNNSAAPQTRMRLIKITL